MLFDTHAHFDDTRFDDDRFNIIEKAHESGVRYILNAAADLASCEAGIVLAEKFPYIYAAVGVHPHNVEGMDQESIEKIKKLAQHEKVVAIGEIGLDYYYDNSPRETQKYWFARQINLARELKKPIIIHDRDAHEDTLDIVKTEKAGETGGVFHCYAGSVEMAREVLDNNLYISIGGVVTFKKARKAVEVVKYVPMDRLLIETDSPYLTPEPYRGKRNDSGYVRLVAEKIAEIKGLTFEEVAHATLENGKRLFNII